MEHAKDHDEMLKKLKTHRKNILLTLDQNGELPISTLRDLSGFPSGSRNHHTSILEEWGLVEMIGRQKENGERVFRLTTEGERFVETHLEDTTPEGLERRVEKLETHYNQLEESKVDESRFEDLIDRMKNGYMDDVVKEVERRLM